MNSKHIIIIILSFIEKTHVEKLPKKQQDSTERICIPKYKSISSLNNDVFGPFPKLFADTEFKNNSFYLLKNLTPKYKKHPSNCLYL